jgi:ATP-dependent DNA helicase RecG
MIEELLQQEEGKTEAVLIVRGWRKDLMDLLAKQKEVTTKDAASFWEISDRAARVRLKKMVEEGLISEIATHAFDPQKKFILK